MLSGLTEVVAKFGRFALFLGRLAIRERYNRVPNDSDVAIYTAGLLGGNYVGFTPGGSETAYKDGDRVEMTQSAIVLENLISKFLFDKAGQGAKKD